MLKRIRSWFVGPMGPPGADGKDGKDCQCNEEPLSESDEYKLQKLERIIGDLSIIENDLDDIERELSDINKELDKMEGQEFVSIKDIIDKDFSFMTINARRRMMGLGPLDDPLYGTGV